jgi:hypothetical protein
MVTVIKRTKTEAIHNYLFHFTQPKTQAEIALMMNCSQSTVSKAIRDFSGYLSWAYTKRPGHHFRKVYFPLDWTFGECHAWLDKRTKSGISKAQINASSGQIDMNRLPF